MGNCVNSQKVKAPVRKSSLPSRGVGEEDYPRASLYRNATVVIPDLQDTSRSLTESPPTPNLLNLGETSTSANGEINLLESEFTEDDARTVQYVCTEAAPENEREDEWKMERSYTMTFAKREDRHERESSNLRQSYQMTKGCQESRADCQMTFGIYPQDSVHTLSSTDSFHQALKPVECADDWKLTTEVCQAISAPGKNGRRLHRNSIAQTAVSLLNI